MSYGINELELRGAVSGQSIVVRGGPFRKCPEDAFGVNMAAGEQPGGDIRVEVVDFGVPDPDALRLRALYACYVALKGESIYVGCGAGIGRTGTFLAVMARIMNPECDGARQRGYPKADGVTGWLREKYREGAVETSAQDELVNSLDLEWERRLYAHWCEAKRLGLPMNYPWVVPF